MLDGRRFHVSHQTLPTAPESWDVTQSSPSGQVGVPAAAGVSVHCSLLNDYRSHPTEAERPPETGSSTGSAPSWLQDFCWEASWLYPGS